MKENLGIKYGELFVSWIYFEIDLVCVIGFVLFIYYFFLFKFLYLWFSGSFLFIKGFGWCMKLEIVLMIKGLLFIIFMSINII